MGSLPYATTRPAPLPAVRTGPQVVPYIAHVAIALILAACVTAPVITISYSLPWFRVEQLALIPFFFFYGCFLLVGLARPIRLNPLFLIGAVYSVCIVLSLCYGVFVLGHQFLLRDLYEIPKAWLPVAFYTLGLESRLTENALRRILHYFSIAMVPVCLYGWAQWMHLGISNWLGQYYSGGFHDEGSLAHYRRVYSTMGNPNLLGVLLTWAIAIFVLALLFRVGNRLINLALTFACLVTLAMTGSRYGLLDTALVFLLIFLLAASMKSRRHTMIGLLALFLPVFVGTTLIVARSNRATLDRFQSLRKPLETDSFSGRVELIWPDAERDIVQSPLFGHGPAKAKYWGVITDSEYLEVLRRFGIIGFCVYFAYFLYPFGLLWNGVQLANKCRPNIEERYRATFLALRFAFILLVTAFVMNVGMSTFYNEPLQGFFWLWIGIGVGAIRTISAGASVTAPSPRQV